MRPYLVTVSCINCYQDITYIVMARDKKQAIELADEDERRFLSNWEVSCKRIKGNKPFVISEFIE